MKTKQLITNKFHQEFLPLLIMSVLVLGLGLSSCVDPGYSYNGGSQLTTYSAGQRINSLPGGYRTESIAGKTYYYHDGHYYQPSSRGYAVVNAPRSSRYYSEYSRYRQSTLSDNRRGGNSYDRNDQRYQQQDGYVTRLPTGYRAVNHRGTTYYRSGDSYYSRQGTGYMIVERPY